MIRVPYCCRLGLLALTLLAGCHRSAHNLSSRLERSTGNSPEATDWTNKRRQGVDFVAVGSKTGTPSGNWRLDIDFARHMRLEVADGSDVLVPMPKPQFSHRGAGVVLDSRAAPFVAATNRRAGLSTAAGRNRLLVSIEPTSWRDPLTRRDYAYTVRVEANGKPYVGGGTFIKASNRLSGTWAVETFKGQRLRPDQFGDKALPFLAIDLSKGTLTGSTGWSKLKGDIRANGDRVSIDPKTALRSPQAGSFEAGFLDALRQASLFRIGKERLTLLVNGQYVMTLRKA